MGITPIPASTDAVLEPPRPRLADYLVDLEDHPPPVDWVVASFAARGTLTLLVARPSVGKTWLGAQFVDGVGRGATVAGLSCTAGRGLYVDGENADDLRRRIVAAKLEPAGFDIIDARRAGLRLDRASGLLDLACITAHVQASLVVLDSLRALAPGVREDSSDDMAALVHGLAGVARDTGAAIVVLHHQSTKAGSATVRGSSAIVDQVDLAFALTREGGDGGLRRLGVVDGKYRLGPEPKPRRLRLVADPPGFVAVGNTTLTGGLIAKIESLAAHVASDGSWTTAQIGDAVEIDTKDDTQRKRLGRALDDLVDGGFWSRLQKGVYAPTADHPAVGT